MERSRGDSPGEVLSTIAWPIVDALEMLAIHSGYLRPWSKTPKTKWLTGATVLLCSWSLGVGNLERTEGYFFCSIMSAGTSAVTQGAGGDVNHWGWD